MKNAIVIYDSRYGNTKKIAESLARGIEEKEIKVNCINIGMVKVSSLLEYDLIAIGGPTHNRKASEEMNAFIANLERINLTDKQTFIFDTKKKGFFAGSAGKAIEKVIEKLGCRIITPRVSAYVKGKEGPLKEGMIEQFHDLGKEIGLLLDS